MNGTSEAPSLQEDPECCPQCGASDALLTLLTSIRKYFACRHCTRRWEVAVIAKVGS